MRYMTFGIRIPRTYIVHIINGGRKDAILTHKHMKIMLGNDGLKTWFLEDMFSGDSMIVDGIVNVTRLS